MKGKTIRILAVLGALLALSAMATPQFRQVLRVLGIGAAVKQFAPEINREINRLSGHKDTANLTTKVVPILSVGVGRSSAVGAAQVSGPKAQVDKVQAVASPEMDLFGREIRIRALIPVSSTNVTNLQRVQGVGVSGIVDLKL